MIRSWTRSIATTVVVGIALALSPVSPVAPAAAAEGFEFARLQGNDRYATAAAIAEETFAEAPVAVLATGEGFADALAGSFYAGSADAPVLLTQRTTLPSSTSDALEELGTEDVVILGGVAAVSAAVEAELESDGYTVRRIAGANRYETAAMIATDDDAELGPQLGGKATAIVARGDNFPDALAGGALAFAGGLPILTTPGPPSSSLDENARDALAELGIEHVLILGGTSAVSQGTENDIKNAGGSGSITTERLAGSDRTETARLVAEWALDNLDFDDTHVMLARGDAFPDALAGSAHGGSEAAPILLTVSSTTLSASGSVGAARYLRDHQDTLEDGHIFGGSAAVSASVEAEAEAIAAGDDDAAPRMSSASANTANDTVTVTYSKPVTCTDSAALRAQFSFAGATPKAPTTVTCNRSTSVVLKFSDVTAGGELTYTDDSATADANDVTDTAGNQATSPQTVTATSGSDSTAPEMSSAAANTSTERVVVTYSEAIQCATTADTYNQFSYSASSSTKPTAISCSGNQATLTFADVTGAGTLTYTDESAAPDANDVKDTAGNSARSPQSVTATLSSDTTGPTMTAVDVNAATSKITVTYDEAVQCTDGAILRDKFAYLDTGGNDKPLTVACTAGSPSVVLTFTTGSLTSEDKSLKYTDAAGNDILDMHNNSAPSQSLAEVPPKMQTAQGDTAPQVESVVVTFNETISCPDPANPVLKSQFLAQWRYTGATPQEPTGYTCATTTPTLTLQFTNVTAAGTLTYTDNDRSAKDDNDVSDSDANQMPNQAIAVEVGDPRPVMQRITVNAQGGFIEVTYSKAVTCVSGTAGQFKYNGTQTAQNASCSGTLLELTFGQPIPPVGQLSYTDDLATLDPNDVKDAATGTQSAPDQTISTS